MIIASDHIQDITPGIKTFWFRAPEPLSFIAGQFTEIRLTHANTDDRGDRRWFTLSSSPTEKLLGFTTQILTDGQVSSFKRALLALQPGQTAQIAEPMGDFVSPKNPSIPLLFVAVGLGVTPVRSIIKQLSDTGDRRDARFLYIGADNSEVPFLDIFNGYGMAPQKFVRPMASGTRDADGLDSPITHRVVEFIQEPKDAYIYLSGPEQTVEKLYRALRQKGISNENLITDYLPGYEQF